MTITIEGKWLRPGQTYLCYTCTHTHCMIRSINSSSSLHPKPKKPRRMRGGELVLYTTLNMQDYHIRQRGGWGYMPCIYKWKTCLLTHAYSSDLLPNSLDSIRPTGCNECSANPSENIQRTVSEEILYMGSYCTGTYLSRYLYICCWNWWLCDSALINPFWITSYVNWHHLSEAVNCFTNSEERRGEERRGEERRGEERSQKTKEERMKSWLTSLRLSQVSDGWTSHLTAMYSDIGHVFDVHRHQHTHIYTCTSTHTDMWTERDGVLDRIKRKAEQAPHKQLAQMLIKAVLSPQVYIHRQPVLPGVL